LVKRSAAIFKGAAAAGLRRSDAVVFCRDLVNRPPSDLHPADLVKTAKKIASRRGSRITLKVFGRNKLKAMGANGILTVARGSAIEPFLIHATYKPAKTSRNTKRIVLVGKGVTFDSGGLSIKTGKGMEDMKCDMAGAAAVISVLKAITDAPPAARPEHEIHVLVPTVENLINENSVKPGDVFYALNGKSVEVLNTDAEGRLILADALSYSERLKPDLMVDLATLTGACVAALGSDYAGLFSTDSKLEAELIAAGKSSGDLVWPLPLAPEYRFAINSSVADIQNIGPGGPGAITAALFLKEFVPAKTHWAHLDIAGPAFVTRGNEVVRPGGTGFGVRLLLKLLSSKGVA
jgi:leucyl aminopeptidase